MAPDLSEMADYHIKLSQMTRVGHVTWLMSNASEKIGKKITKSCLILGVVTDLQIDFLNEHHFFDIRLCQALQFEPYGDLQAQNLLRNYENFVKKIVNFGAKNILDKMYFSGWNEIDPCFAFES